MKRLIAGTINYYPSEVGWENVHMDISDRPLAGSDKPADIVASFTDLPNHESDAYDEVRCHQALEHLTFSDALIALVGFANVLKPDGILDIEVPDIKRIGEAIAEDRYPLTDLLRMIYGDQSRMQDSHFNQHRWGYDEEVLSRLLTGAGFRPGARIGDNGTLQLRFRARRV